MIPDYRVRFYCLLGLIFCVLGAFATSEQLLAAIHGLGIDARTGFGRQGPREHLLFAQRPWMYTWQLLKAVMVFLFCIGGGLTMLWGVLRGRRAFARGR